MKLHHLTNGDKVNVIQKANFVYKSKIIEFK